MPRGRTLLLIAVLAWAAVAGWNALKPLPPGTHVTSLATRLAESQVQIVAAATGSEIEARELAAIDRASELIVLDAAPLSRAVGRGLLLQRTKWPNIKIVLVSDPRSEAYGGTPVEYLESLERAGVIVARVRLDRLRDCIPLYSALWRLTVGWWSDPFDEHPGEPGLRASLRARNRKADQRRLLVADDGAGGWVSLLSAAPDGDLAVQITGGLAHDIAASELKIAAWSSGGDDRLPAPPRAAARGPGSIDARFLTEGAIRGAMLDALRTAAAGDEVALAAPRLSDRRVIDAVLRAAARGAHVRVLLDPGATPNSSVAAELERGGSGNIELRWRVPPALATASLALVARRGELWASAGAADFTRPSLDDVDLESAIELRLPLRAAAARALETHFDAKWAAGGAYPRYAVESQADYWQYRFTQAAALAAF
jgi:hypothetical protein